MSNNQFMTTMQVQTTGQFSTFIVSSRFCQYYYNGIELCIKPVVLTPHGVKHGSFWHPTNPYSGLRTEKALYARLRQSLYLFSAQITQSFKYNPTYFTLLFCPLVFWKYYHNKSEYFLEKYRVWTRKGNK